MSKLGIVKKRIAALDAAFAELEASLENNNEEQITSVNVKDELSKLSLEELKEINLFVTDLMLHRASGKKTERIGTRMPLLVKENMVHKYMEEGDAAWEVKNEYNAIAAKRGKERNDDEKKKFMAFRNNAEKWFKERYPENN